MTNVQLRIFKMLSLIAFVLICVFTTLDVLEDIRQGVSFNHLFHELGLVVLSLIGIAAQTQVIINQEKTIKVYFKEMDELRKEKEAFRLKVSNFSGEFMQLIDSQFDNWQLTPGEKDVGILLIKGLSMKEVAEIRKSNESTVRQQASSIYRKSGLGGRQELAAFFLDDLLVVSAQ